MKKLLKLQFRNIFHNKLFYVCFGITLLTTTVLSFVTGIAFKGFKPSPAWEEIMSLFRSEVGIANMLFITLFCTLDFVEGTAKNIIARGYSKFKFLLSKCISCFISLFVMYGIIVIIDLILFSKNGFGWEASMIPLLIFCTFKILAYTILYGTIAFILEKNSTAIIVNLFFPQVAKLVLSLADTNFKLDISKYWIDNIGSKFIDKPTFNGLPGPIIMILIYITLCLFIGSRILKNKEVK